MNLFRQIALMAGAVLALHLGAGPAAAHETGEQIANADPALKADQIVIVKSARQLTLMREGQLLRRYDIALGRRPWGAKVQDGDLRTPEGRYEIDWRNPDSQFHLSLHVSYPGPADIARAHELGVDPGDMIMIHGLPNGREAEQIGHPLRDWTHGCIAVTNAEIEEIWHLVDDGTPVIIRPLADLEIHRQERLRRANGSWAAGGRDCLAPQQGLEQVVDQHLPGPLDDLVHGGAAGEHGIGPGAQIGH